MRMNLYFILITVGCLVLTSVIAEEDVMLIARSNNARMTLERMENPDIPPFFKFQASPDSNFNMEEALHRYCNRPNDTSYSQEGKAPPNATLELAIVSIRHGDRAPILPVRSESVINCGTQDTPLLLQYLDTLQPLRGPANHLSTFPTYPLYPTEKQCKPGQLTYVGAQQHLNLGRTLHKAYIEDHNLLDKNWKNQIKLFSTYYNRTVQSAVALLFGFLPNFDISNIEITPSLSEEFCMTDYYCECPLLKSLQSQIHEKLRRLLHSQPSIVRLLQQLNPIVKSDPNDIDITDPFMMVDSLVGYLCHGSHLPCIPGTSSCVTLEHVRNLIAYLDWVSRQTGRDGTYTKFAKLEMLGFLNYMVNHIKSFIAGKDATRFLLFSGHDTTLQPLARALGIGDGDMIPYASRIVIELYKQVINNKSKHVIKILFNGNDLTKHSSFCKSYFRDSVKGSPDYGVCPFEAFRKFVEEDYFLSMGAKSFSSACALPATSDP